VANQVLPTFGLEGMAFNNELVRNRKFGRKLTNAWFNHVEVVYMCVRRL